MLAVVCSNHRCLRNLLNAVGQPVPGQRRSGCHASQLNLPGIRYALELPDEHRDTAQEVHAAHAGRCPNARSVSPAIEIATDLEIVSPVAA